MNELMNEMQGEISRLEGMLDQNNVKFRRTLTKMSIDEDEEESKVEEIE